MSRILFVCLGNICRSPLAEAILRRKAQERGIQVTVDSAGTGDYHIGELHDTRAQRVGFRRGCEMSMRARQLHTRDFDEFDLIVVMDHANLSSVHGWQGAVPAKVRLARSFDPSAVNEVVPDPYYGKIEDFEAVADMLESASDGILDWVAERKA